MRPMSSDDLLPVQAGTVIEDDSLTLEQLCDACGVQADWVISLIAESIIEPQGDESIYGVFPEPGWRGYVPR